ncbi:hypothetical protein MTR67_002341 [Solanum verrucosum]|uniref:Uncharacterized protein n=1 Tax=Solanum verrucosum TaxID=315347 RepID=A0AAF0PQP8_SOLVR|nr:hypothetical protein MTR67_002341 [Solanum verrucosum]
MGMLVGSPLRYGRHEKLEELLVKEPGAPPRAMVTLTDREGAREDPLGLWRPRPQALATAQGPRLVRSSRCAW